MQAERCAILMSLPLYRVSNYPCSWWSAGLMTHPETARRFQETIPNARLDILEDCGHMTPVEDPEGVARVIRSFLSEH